MMMHGLAYPKWWRLKDILRAENADTFNVNPGITTRLEAGKV
jgi:hypothetical protein